MAQLIGYHVLSAPETVKIPYPLRSGRKTVSIPGKNTANKIVSCPYLSQIQRPPVLVDPSVKAADLAEALFKNVTISIHLHLSYKKITALRCMVSKF